MGNAIYLPRVDSTNNYAANLLAGRLAQAPTAIMTFDQRAGKGQRGNSWTTQAGKDLAISFICAPQIPIKQAPQWNMLLAVWIAEHLANTLNLDAIKVKWPNDIYFQQKKVGGILVENQFSGKQVVHSIFGLGLNVNSPGILEFNSTSLAEITQKPLDLFAFANALQGSFMKFHADFTRHPFQHWHINRYYQYLLGYQENHTFSDNKRGRFKARVLEVDEHGRLVLLAAQHGKLRYDVKELQWHF